MQQHSTTQQPSRPFLKWAGKKQRLLSQLLPLLPTSKRLIHPFVGAGSLFLTGRYSEAVLNDANPDLMALWAFIKERPAKFCADASTFFCEENRNQQSYARIRQEFNSATDRYERAVRLLYLNSFGNSGLFRGDQKSCLRTSYGHPRTIPPFPWDQIALAHEKLKTAHILGGDYRFAMSVAKDGDLVYCDPPYLPLKASAFSYTAPGFSLAEHEQLVRAAKQAAEQGATVAISNHDNPVTRELYRAFEVHELLCTRHIAASAGARTPAPELLAILRPRRR